MVNQIKKLTEQLQDKSLKIPLLLRIQKLHVLRQLLLTNGDIAESDTVANTVIQLATRHLTDIPAENRLEV